VAEDKETSGEAGEKKPPAKRGRKPLNAAELALRNAAIIAALHAGDEQKDVAKKYGLTTRSVERLKASFQLRPTALERRPMEIIERVLRTYEQQMESFAAMALDCRERAPAVAIAAMKGGADALERYTALLADVGKLPDNLELFRAESEMLQTGRRMAEALAKVANGEMSAIEALELFDALVEYKTPLWADWEAPAGSVRELGEGSEAA
jgi:hypothetical protein